MIINPRKFKKVHKSMNKAQKKFQKKELLRTKFKKVQKCKKFHKQSSKNFINQKSSFIQDSSWKMFKNVHELDLKVPNIRA